MNVAVIPARGGSKRIQNKNMKLFCGTPIIKYSIDVAIQSGIFDKIIVSTDNDEIAKYSEDNGADVPFIRPANLSDDFSSVNDVIVHAAKWMLEKGWSTKVVCCLYATAPMIKPENIIEGLNILVKGDWDFVLTAGRFNSNINRSFNLNEAGQIKMLFDENNFFKRSQDLQELYFDAAQFCFGWISSWLKKNNVYSSKTTILKIAEERVVDIDTTDDWRLAELKYNLLYKNIERSI